MSLIEQRDCYGIEYNEIINGSDNETFDGKRTRYFKRYEILMNFIGKLNDDFKNQDISSFKRDINAINELSTWIHSDLMEYLYSK